MDTGAHVLLIGEDDTLLETRAAVLRHFWPVCMATPALDEPSLYKANLVVLCNTIPEHDRQHWIDAVRAIVPGLLIVKMNGFDAGPRLGADATVGLSGGPAALVSTIYGLLTERGLGSRGWANRETTLMDAADGTTVQ